MAAQREHRGQPLNQFAKVEVRQLQLHLIRFDFREIEDVIDHGQQVIAALFDGLGKLTLLLKAV